MKKDCDLTFARFFIDAFGERMHIPTEKEINEYINKDVGEFNGRKNWYCIKLDNVADWGFAEAFVIWKRIEKKLIAYYDDCEIYHADSKYYSGLYTWGKEKRIQVEDTKILLNTRMLYPRCPKECSNNVYISMNDKGLFWLIVNELKSRKIKKDNDAHTYSIGGKKYSTNELAVIFSKQPKNMANLIEDIVKPLKADDRYHDSLQKMTRILLGKYLETTYLSDLEESIIKAAYIKTGGEGTIW